MDPQVIPDSEFTNNESKTVIKQEVINFKRRKISDIQNIPIEELENNVIFLDTDTALEPEPLIVDVKDEEQIELRVTNLEDDDDSYDINHEGVIVEEYQEEHQSLYDDQELEEGEVRNPLDIFRRRYLNSYDAKYKCPLCERSFTQKGNLMRHYHTHTGAKPFACSLCGHKFTQKSNLQKHIATHNGDKKFECGVCHKRFVQKANLIRHLRIHTGEKPFECELCGHKFTQKGNLNKHLQLHSSDTGTTCDFCQCSFSSYAAKMRHENTVHGDNWNKGEETDEAVIIQDFQCDECPAIFKTVRALTKHRKFHE